MAEGTQWMTSIPPGTTLAQMWEMWNNNQITSDTFRYWLNSIGLDGDQLIMDQTQLAALVQSSPTANNPEQFEATGTGAAPPAATPPANTAGGDTDMNKFLSAVSTDAAAPATRYRDVMRERYKLSEAPLHEQIRGERRLGWGYQPALGGYLSHLARTAEEAPGSLGDAFAAYLQQDEMPSLTQRRSDFSDLATGLSGGLATKGQYDPVAAALYGFGDEAKAKDARTRLLSSALSALGGNPWITQGVDTLGQVYDAMVGQNPTGGYGDFSKWITSAYQS